MKKGILKIELKSDLCAGSGFAYGNTIDTDVVYNEAGLPYIPARRLKGCLREVAGMIGMKNTDEVFGKARNSESGSLRISNAMIKNCDTLTQAILSNRKLNDQMVLDLFTSVNAQTKIERETGIAEENTLRFTRVVNQHDPVTKENLVFYAEVIMNDDDEETVTRCVKALRHIGTHRNRGLGNVKCSLTDVETVNFNSAECSEADGQVILEYTLKNTQPLMLSANNDDETSLFISGQTVLGALASIYLKTNGKEKAESDEFRDLFLNGTVKYLNAYPTDNSKDYMTPVPLFINRMKKTKAVMNALNLNKTVEQLKIENPQYCAANGNQPKKIKNSFARLNGQQIRLCSPETEIIYHHSKTNKNADGSEGILYSLEALKANQLFTGRILTTKKYEKLILSLLNFEGLSFGKSKSAQYGHCQLVECNTVEPETVEFKKGDTVAVALNSSAIFNINNHNSVNFSEVKERIAEELNIKYEPVELNSDNSVMQTELITGYQGTWNLKRPSFSAVMYGSAFVFKLTEDFLFTSSTQVGSKKQEGYGLVSVCKVEPGNYALEKSEDTVSNNADYSVLNPYLKLIYKQQAEDQWLADFISSKNVNIGISSATLGRITLMLKQSAETKHSGKEAIKDWSNRIDSIKTISVKKKVQSFVKNYVDENGFKVNNQAYKQYISLLSPNESNEIQENWSRLMLQALTYIKYTKKEGGSENEEEISED